MFDILFDKKANNSFKKLAPDYKIKIGGKLEDLKTNSELGKSLNGNLSGLWSLRIEKYLLIYQIKRKELIIIVLEVGHRKNIYN